MNNNVYYEQNQLNNVYNYLSVEEVKQYWKDLLAASNQQDLNEDAIEVFTPLTIAR